MATELWHAGPADFTNSSLGPWLALEKKLALEGVIELAFDIQPCYNPDEPEATCRYPCSEASRLFNEDYPMELLNCGVWALLGGMWIEQFEASPHDFNLSGASTIEDVKGKLEAPLERFVPLGLDYRNLSQITHVRDQVSGVLLQTFDWVQGSVTRSAREAIACSTARLYPLTNTLIRLGAYERESGLGPCLSSICRPRVVDPDLGGIGVSKC